MKIVIIDYGAGNVKSVQFALERLGFKATCTNDAKEIKEADKVIFPGVGEAQSAMQEIRKFGLDKVIPNLKQPVLGICLGMQLMCRNSEENDTDCLGIFPIDVIKFQVEYKIPHIGWNQILDLKSHLMDQVAENAFVYYVHSYYAEQCTNTVAICDYILPFSAALQKDNFYATQFHPEKSAGIGEQILKNFLEL